MKGRCEMKKGFRCGICQEYKSNNTLVFRKFFIRSNSTDGVLCRKCDNKIKKTRFKTIEAYMMNYFEKLLSGK